MFRMCTDISEHLMTYFFLMLINQEAVELDNLVVLGYFVDEEGKQVYITPAFTLV